MSQIIANRNGSISHNNLAIVPTTAILAKVSYFQGIKNQLTPSPAWLLDIDGSAAVQLI